MWNAWSAVHCATIYSFVIVSLLCLIIFLFINFYIILLLLISCYESQEIEGPVVAFYHEAHGKHCRRQSYLSRLRGMGVGIQG